MATKMYTGGAMTVNAADFIVLGAGDPQSAMSWIVELRPTGATFSVTFRGRVAGIVDPTTSDTQLRYYDELAGLGTEIAGSTPVAGSTSSAVARLRIPADGLTMALDFSAFSAGSLVLVATPIRGS